MTADELEQAVNKLISEANAESEKAKKEYESDCLAEKNRALARRMFRSTILEDLLAYLKTEYDALVLRIQSDLDESLSALYAENETGGGGGEGVDPGDAPYEVDYRLSMRDRYIDVKNYYLGLEDKAAALAAFEADEVAKDYLGNYYDYLYQLLLMVQV